MGQVMLNHTATFKKTPKVFFIILVLVLQKMGQGLLTTGFVIKHELSGITKTAEKSKPGEKNRRSKKHK
ncbi:MAG: hypothetical protein GY857_17890 [Desulfobacula sp.]|nr:hypothetical protein [Desulfobacula sp.]